MLRLEPPSLCNFSILYDEINRIYFVIGPKNHGTYFCSGGHKFNKTFDVYTCSCHCKLTSKMAMLLGLFLKFDFKFICIFLLYI